MKKQDLLDKIDENDFLYGYFEAALWSSTDESDDLGGEPLDENYSNEDFTVEGLKEMMGMAQRFLEMPHVTAAIEAVDEKTRDAWGQAGRDLWFTQNGHGVGFWETPDRWPTHEGRVLDRAAKEIGEASIYVGDNGRLYVFNG